MPTYEVLVRFIVKFVRTAASQVRDFVLWISVFERSYRTRPIGFPVTYSRGSVIFPVSADAAAVSGLAR